MDIKQLTPADLAYIEGFVKQCQDKGVDPEAMLEKMAKPCKPMAKKGKGTFGGKAAPKFTAKKAQLAAPIQVAKAMGPAAAVGAAVGAAGGASALAAKIKAMIASALKSRPAAAVGGAAAGAGAMHAIDKQGQAAKAAL